MTLHLFDGNQKGKVKAKWSFASDKQFGTDPKNWHDVYIDDLHCYRVLRFDHPTQVPSAIFVSDLTLNNETQRTNLACPKGAKAVMRSPLGPANQSESLNSAVVASAILSTNSRKSNSPFSAVAALAEASMPVWVPLLGSTGNTSYGG